MKKILIVINILVLLIPLFVSRVKTKKYNVKKLEEVINYEESCIKNIRERK